MSMNNKLLATTADIRNVDAVKQLFSSAYFNGGWKGDFILLSHDIPEAELKWFRERGILVYKCKPIFEGGFGRISSATLDKFYLFKEEFKKWKNIVYLDADIIVKTSLSPLADLEGFNAVKEIPLGKPPVENSVLSPKINGEIFNAGVFVFSTDIIKESDFSKLEGLFLKYKDSVGSDQEIFNLFFEQKWSQLPLFYNLNVYKVTGRYLFFKRRLRGILHFIGESKPWKKNNPFYKEWLSNLNRADKIDIRKRYEINKLPDDAINRYSNLFKMMIYLFSPILLIDKYIGIIWVFIRGKK